MELSQLLFPELRRPSPDDLLAVAAVHQHRVAERPELFANLTCLASECTTILADAPAGCTSVVSHYRSVTWPSVAFHSTSATVLKDMLIALCEESEITPYPMTRGEAFFSLVNQTDLGILRQAARVVAVKEFVQLLVTPETFKPCECFKALPLGPQHLSDLNSLAAFADIASFSPTDLVHGPHFGIFSGDRLVSMAGTRAAHPEQVILGNIATKPQYRRRKLGSACVSRAVQENLKMSPRVIAHCFAGNKPAIALGKSLGFVITRTLYFTETVFP